MTTQAAADYYLVKHFAMFEGKPAAVHNPHNKPLEELPVIYGFNNGGSRGWLQAVLMSQDGTWLGSHTCSDEAYMPHDLGILEGSGPDRHEDFKKHYPDGYRMEFVPSDKLRVHDGLNCALKIHDAAVEKSHHG